MVDKAEQLFLQIQRDQAKNLIDSTFEALVTEPAKQLSALPEEIFVEVFLPFFCGEKSFDDNRQVLVNWISIAGSPSKEVVIVDNNNTPLFKVPPFTDSTDIDVLNKSKAQEFYSMLQNYNLHKNHLPIMGDRYIKEAINRKTEALKQESVVHSEYEKRWFSIFERYGKHKAKASEASQDTTKLDPDEIEYD